MKKVLFLSAANSIHTVRWVNALSKKYEVHLVYCSNHIPELNKINSHVILHQLKYKAPMGYYLNCLMLKKIYKEVKPDVVNVHYASGYGTLSRIARIPNTLLSLWGSDVYDFPYRSIINKIILKKNVLWAKELASTSKAMANKLKEQIPIKKEIFITPFGVDVNKFKNIHKKKNDDLIRIGNIKSLEEVYGIDYLILSFKKLLDILNNDRQEKVASSLRLLIYGNGSKKEELKDLIKENNLKKIVFLKGKIPNNKVPEALNKLDIFCATSFKESFGVSIVEAMACEIPVVASNVDGFKEVIEDNKTGIIVKVKDVDATANALKKLILDSKMKDEFGKEGRQRVLKYFDWNKNVMIMEKIYDKMIKEDIDD